MRGCQDPYQDLVIKSLLIVENFSYENNRNLCRGAMQTINAIDPAVLNYVSENWSSRRWTL